MTAPQPTRRGCFHIDRRPLTGYNQQAADKGELDMKIIRWGENDRYFGPFTYSVSKYYRSTGLVLQSAGDDETERPAYARIGLGRLHVLFPLPGWMIRPDVEVCKFRHLSPEDLARLGPTYTVSHRRKFGAELVDGCLHLSYGADRNDGRSDSGRVIFFPWKEWRFVSNTLQGLDGETFCVLPEKMDWKERHAMQDACPVRRFAFLDYDGEQITATTRLEVMRWKRGAGSFRWLSYVWPDRVRSSLDLRFSSEVGRRKGSWKGGTIGHSIDAKPGELHEAAFKRYCAQEGLTFVGEV